MASKRYEQAATLVDRKKAYALADAVAILKEMPKVKFDETVELSVSLGIDPAKTDQAVRGTVRLPHGTGKTRRVVVFCKGERELAAKEAGADYVGSTELISKIEGGWLDFDVAIASPELMREVSKLGRVLGPRGLMPSPKVGTVTEDVANAVAEVKQGKVEFKMDKLANLHVVIGKLSFAVEQLVANANAAMEAIIRARPASLKGQFIRQAALSGTMSPGVVLDIRPLLEQHA